MERLRDKGATHLFESKWKKRYSERGVRRMLGSGHASRKSLEVYSRPSPIEAQEECNSVISRFPIWCYFPLHRSFRNTSLRVRQWGMGIAQHCTSGAVRRAGVGTRPGRHRRRSETLQRPARGLRLPILCLVCRRGERSLIGPLTGHGRVWHAAMRTTEQGRWAVARPCGAPRQVCGGAGQGPGSLCIAPRCVANQHSIAR